jgi:hypothetical protein
VPLANPSLLHHANHLFGNFDVCKSIGFLSIILLPFVALSEETGETLALRECSKCHAFPPPKSMLQRDWEYGAIPYLEDLLRLQQLKNYDEKTVRKVLDNWSKIKDYYIKNGSLKNPGEQASREDPIQSFNAKEVLKGTDVSAIFYHQAHKALYVGDTKTRTAIVLNNQGKILNRFELNKIPSFFCVSDNNIIVCGINSLDPLDSKQGEVGHIDPDGNYIRLLNGLNRPTKYLEFQHNMASHSILLEYGIRLGKVTLFRDMKEIFTINLSGGIDCEIIHEPDNQNTTLYVLFAQEHECIIRLSLGSNDEVQQDVLIKKQPGWGFTAMDILDFDNDGELEILTSNGDTTEFRSNPRTYHGIRAYDIAQDGLNESWFVPVHGVMDFVSLDYNNDGQLDLASVSYFGDFKNNPEQGAMIHQNKSNGEFVSRPLPQSEKSRWCRIGKGDLDLDGDDDLILGALNYETTKRPYEKNIKYLESFKTPKSVLKEWNKNGNRLLLLMNNN